ncbi:MAG: hypothetical protein ACE5JG_07105, partial [Planctomycetota bacterium]
MPGPLGDDAIEWDYSRISRALGLAGTPTLQELPHSGVAVLGLPDRQWSSVGERYRSWADQAGWTFVYASARPTVAVPDPVIYTLGRTVAGPDSLILGRSLNLRRPRVGRRFRSRGASFALTPGERWLMAANRVRRRCRQEAARKGLVVVVDSAHLLTASAAAVLAYLIEAHRAWKGRMLCRDAKAYVVFLAPPDHEQRVLDLLEAFGIRGDVASLGEAERPPPPPAAAFVDVEEEHLLSALRDAPFALSSEDVRATFGRSALETCRRLRDQGLVAEEVQNGRSCWVETVQGRELSGLPPPP